MSLSQQPHLAMQSLILQSILSIATETTKLTSEIQRNCHKDLSDAINRTPTNLPMTQLEKGASMSCTCAAIEEELLIPLKKLGQNSFAASSDEVNEEYLNMSFLVQASDVLRASTNAVHRLMTELTKTYRQDPPTSSKVSGQSPRAESREPSLDDHRSFKDSWREGHSPAFFPSTTNSALGTTQCSSTDASVANSTRYRIWSNASTLNGHETRPLVHTLHSSLKQPETSQLHGIHCKVSSVGEISRRVGPARTDALRRARSVRFEDMPSVISQKPDVSRPLPLSGDLSEPSKRFRHVPIPLPIRTHGVPDARGRAFEMPKHETPQTSLSSLRSIYRRRSMPLLDGSKRLDSRSRSPVKDDVDADDEEFPDFAKPASTLRGPARIPSDSAFLNHPRYGDRTSYMEPSLIRGPFSRTTDQAADVNDRTKSGSGLASLPACRIANRNADFKITHDRHRQSWVPIYQHKNIGASHDTARTGKSRGVIPKNLRRSMTQEQMRKMHELELDNYQTGKTTEWLREWAAMRKRLESGGLPLPFEEYVDQLKSLRLMPRENIRSVDFSSGSGSHSSGTRTESTMTTGHGGSSGPRRQGSTASLVNFDEGKNMVKADAHVFCAVDSSSVECESLTRFPTLEQFERHEAPRGLPSRAIPRFPSLPSMEPLVPLRSGYTPAGRGEHDGSSSWRHNLVKEQLLNLTATTTSQKPESSGEFFRRVMGITEHSTPVSSTWLPSSVAPPAGARLATPFDPVAETAALHHEPLSTGPRRSSTISGPPNRFIPGSRRPYSVHFDGSGRLPWETFLKREPPVLQRSPSTEKSSINHPPVPPKLKMDPDASPQDELGCKEVTQEDSCERPRVDQSQLQGALSKAFHEAMKEGGHAKDHRHLVNEPSNHQQDLDRDQAKSPILAPESLLEDSVYETYQRAVTFATDSPLQVAKECDLPASPLQPTITSRSVSKDDRPHLSTTELNKPSAILAVTPTIGLVIPSLDASSAPAVSSSVPSRTTQAIDEATVSLHDDSRSISAIQSCVESLKKLGFGSQDEGGVSRLVVYAQAAEGDLEEAMDLIEDDRRAYAEL